MFSHFLTILKSKVHSCLERRLVFNTNIKKALILIIIQVCLFIHHEN